jgi:hypothetical protein
VRDIKLAVNVTVGPNLRRVLCDKLGAQYVPEIAPVGPTLTRPPLFVIERLNWGGGLWGADPECDHYVYAAWSGVKCARCPGWYCA